MNENEEELAAAYAENTKLQMEIMNLRQQVKDKDERIETLQDQDTAKELMKN